MARALFDGQISYREIFPRGSGSQLEASIGTPLLERVYLTEVIPAHVRTVGFSLACSLATAIFGGFTPAISTALIGATGDTAIPGAWYAAAAVCRCWRCWRCWRC